MSFNANDYDTSDTFAPLPAGKYTASIVKAERKESMANPGNYYLNLQMVINKGKYRKRVIFAMLNLKNSNDKAQEIAEQHLAMIMKAVGVMSIPDKWSINKLLNKQMQVRLIIRKGDGQYGDQNQVVAYSAVEGKSEDTTNTPAENPFDEPKKKKKKKKKGKKNKATDVPF